MVEISMYPLTQQYDQPILSFINKLKNNGLDVTVTSTSTLIHGDFDELYNLVGNAIREAFSDDKRTVFVMKVLNTEVSGER